jgi:hypothetical protein
MDSDNQKRIAVIFHTSEEFLFPKVNIPVTYTKCDLVNWYTLRNKISSKYVFCK